MASSSKYWDSVECSDQPLDFAFHPKRENILAAALVDGSLEVHDIRRDEGPSNNDDDDEEPDSILSSLSLHAQMLPAKGPAKQKHASCRTVEFSTDGERIYTGGSAGDLCCIDAERVCKFTTKQQKSVTWRVESAAEGTLNPLLVVRPFHTSPSLLATGDDLGGVRVWDERIRAGNAPAPSYALSSKERLPRGCVLSWKENEDYISDMELSEDGNTLLATSADGRLSVFDLRMARDPSTKKNPDQKPFRLSDAQDDELLSLKIMKNGKKVVCGTQDGVLSVFSWGTWGDCSDRFPGHPSSIDALLKVDEDTLLTGSSDGWIRVVQIHPDKFVGVLGQDHGGFPVEKLGFNASREIVGSVSHDSHVHLWDALVLQEGSDDEEESEDEKEEEDSKQDGKPKASKVVVTTGDGNNSDDDWGDMDDKAKADSDDDDDDDDDDEDSDEDDSNDEEVATVNEKRKKRLKTDSEKFFDDL
jgi:WD40 repeat protein